MRHSSVNIEFRRRGCVSHSIEMHTVEGGEKNLTVELFVFIIVLILALGR